MRIVLAGGGTAGHVSPALALAEALEGDDLTFLGTQRGIEATMVPAAGHAFAPIEVRGFDRARPWALPGVGLDALRAVGQARAVLRSTEADVVVGMGGYVSLPAAWAARLTGVPVVLHEQNIVLGLAHRASRPVARRICVSFEDTLAQAGRKGILVGNPVARSIALAARPETRRAGLEAFSLEPDRKTVLVFGGSLGARSVNAAALALARLWADRTDIQMLHISGRSAYDEVVAAATGGGGLIHRVVPYVDRMAEAYAVADAGICRGGATTIAEICVAQVPCVIVPYPHHRDRQQERHARVLEDAGAALSLRDDALDAGRLAELLGRILDPQVGDGMRAALGRLARPDAARQLADVVREVGG